jgi:DNA-binding NarL/FixJ family response regulator
MNKSEPYKIFIVDDHPLIRQGLRHLLLNDEILSVCGEAEDMSECKQKLKKLAPDLVIVDINLPDGSGLDLIKRIHAFSPGLPVLVSSMHDERLLADRALQAGAMGYISKQEAPEHLVAAVHKILSGKVYLSTEMTERLLMQGVAGSAPAVATPMETLTNRELEVFEQIGEGNSTLQIAEHLNISVKTIESHRAHIKEKLNLANSTELTREAMKWALQV